MPHPPKALPDHFADDEGSRSWFGISLTVVGLAMSLYFFSVSLRNFVDEPTSTDIALSLTQGTAEALTLVCANALGCSVRHVYADAGCNAAALAAGASTRNKTLASGEEAVVQLCGSPLFGDGVLVTLPLGAATGLLSSPLSYRSGTVGGAGGQALALPHAPVSTAQLQRAATALEMGLTVAVAVDGAATQYWEAATPYSSSTQCSSSGGGVLVAPAVAATCYLLKARPTTTTATTTKTFSLLNMLEAWGGCLQLRLRADRLFPVLAGRRGLRLQAAQGRGGRCGGPGALRRGHCFGCELQALTF